MIGILVRKLGACVALVATVAACTRSGSGARTVSVFSVQPGQCFTAPKNVKVQLSALTRTPCTSSHTQEAYAVVEYAAAGGVPAQLPSAAPSLSSTYPGDDKLTTFAKGACAQRYAGYVGVDYLDSALFFTYLLPSARSWEQAADRNVICFVTTTGSTLTSSVRDSRK